MSRTQAAIELLKAWSTVKAVDHHCHPLWRWPRETTVMDLRAVFTEALDPRIAADHVPATVAYRDALRRIAGELGCAATEEAILQARDREGPAAYTNELLRRSGTGVMLLDHGFASAEAFTPAEHVQAIGIPQREVVRLELLAEQLIGQAETADEWFVVVRSRLREAAKAGAVGVKTIAAYRAGLRLRPATVGQVEADFTRLHAMVKDGEAVRLTGAPLVHNLLLEAVEECLALGLPLQVHCGFGDPDEDLAEGSPLGLRPLLADPLYEGLQIALLHCYPYHREAAYLCSAYPGVFMDLSLTLPLAGFDGARAMREVLGLCPWTKLLYASDASRLPECFLVAAAVHREALASALAEVVEAGILTHDEAVAAGTQVLVSNASLLYHL